MAVTITPAEIAVAIRAATAVDAVPDPVATVLQFMAASAGAMTMEYAPGAPDAMHNAAVIRLAGWLYDADPTDSRIARALDVSGAASLLAPWRVHRAGAIGSLEPTPGGVTPPAPAGAGLPPFPTEPGQYILTVVNGDLAWLAFPSPS